MIGVLFSPNETFADIARRPNILLPLIILFVISVVSTVLVIPRIDFETGMRDQLANSGKLNGMSTEEADRVIRIGTAGVKIFIYSLPLIMLGVWALFAGVLLISFKLFGGEGTFKQAYSVMLYAWVPMLIKGIVGMCIVLAKGTVGMEEMADLVRSNPGFLVGMKTNPGLFSLLSSFDVFSIWMVILLIIGFSFVARVSKAKSAVIVITLWAVWTLGATGFAAIGGAANAKAAAQ
jgi:hypothetical protein